MDDENSPSFSLLNLMNFYDFITFYFFDEISFFTNDIEVECIFLSHLKVFPLLLFEFTALL